MLHPFKKKKEKKPYQLLSYLDLSFFMQNGTATGMVAFVIVNKSKILSVKLREKTIKGRALAERV